jgi:hypothetical protein
MSREATLSVRDAGLPLAGECGSALMRPRHHQRICSLVPGRSTPRNTHGAALDIGRLICSMRAM